MTENEVNFCGRFFFFFYNLNIEYLFLNSTILPHCSYSFEILLFCLRRPGFLSRQLTVVRKCKALLELLARELYATGHLGIYPTEKDGGRQPSSDRPVFCYHL